MDDFDGPNHWLKNDNFTESYRLWSFFEHILTSNEDEVVLDNKKIIPSLTSWKMFRYVFLPQSPSQPAN